MFCIKVVAYVLCQGRCVCFVSGSLRMLCVRVVAYGMCHASCMWFVSG